MNKQIGKCEWCGQDYCLECSDGYDNPLIYCCKSCSDEAKQDKGGE